jgi:hypothetical protein
MNWSDIAAAAATLFFVMDPLGNIPVFNSVLSRFEPQRRALITARELVIALVIMLVLLFAGTAILDLPAASPSRITRSGNGSSARARTSSGSRSPTSAATSRRSTAHATRTCAWPVRSCTDGSSTRRCARWRG